MTVSPVRMRSPPSTAEGARRGAAAAPAAPDEPSDYSIGFTSTGYCVLFLSLFAVAGAPLMAVAANKFIPATASAATPIDPEHLDLLNRTYTHMMANWLHSDGTVVPMHDYKALEASFQELFKNYNESKGKIVGLEEQVEYWQKQAENVPGYQANISELEEKNRFLETELGELKTKYATLEGKYTELETELGELKKEYAALEGKNTELNKELEECTQLVNTTKRGCEDLEEECNGYKSKVTQLQEFIKAHENFRKEVANVLQSRHEALTVQAKGVTEMAGEIDELLKTFQQKTPRGQKKKYEEDGYGVSGKTENIPDVP